MVRGGWAISPRMVPWVREGWELPVDGSELRELCLALPGAGEEFPFGDEVSVFKVGGKMFALCGLDAEPLELSVKCEPDADIHS